MIKVENVSKSFGTVKALSHLSFQIEKGGVVGFLGPNGAGKTTTMRIITGFLSADEGDVWLDGISVSQQPLEVQRKIGYLPENNPLYKEMLVAEFLSLVANLRDIPPSKRRSRYDFVVAAVGIGEVFYRPIEELSKGYRQRVGMAAAMLGEPKVLILDEPTEGLDPNQRSQIRSLIKELARERTIVLSTHVMQEAAALCDRLLVINHGQLVAADTTERLLGLATGKQTLSLKVEGSQVEDLLRQLESVESIEVNSLEDNRYEVRLVSSTGSIQPEISRLARENGWIIWELKEMQRDLEEVFRVLTQGG